MLSYVLGGAQQQQQQQQKEGKDDKKKGKGEVEGKMGADTHIPTDTQDEEEGGGSKTGKAIHTPTDTQASAGTDTPTSTYTQGEGMVKEIFVELMDMMLPIWDPERKRAREEGVNVCISVCMCV